MDRPKQRDADRSRAAILDAAETLFAEHGFDAVTMAQVGAAAGVSRGTPGYFFATKDGLYRVVVERAAATLHILAETLASRLRTETDAVVRVTAIVDAFLALLTSRGSLVRLIDRESAAGTATPHAQALQVALDGLDLERDGTALTILAMCWFPVSHPGAARALGVDPSSVDFPAMWRRRVIEALQLGMTPALPVKEAAAPAPVAEVPIASAADAGSPSGSPAVVPVGEVPKKKKKKKKKKD